MDWFQDAIEAAGLLLCSEPDGLVQAQGKNLNKYSSI